MSECKRINLVKETISSYSPDDYDDIVFDVEAEWAALNQWFPDLADRTQILFEQSQIGFGNFIELKEAICKHAESLTKVNSQCLTNILAIASEIDLSSAEVADNLVRYDEDELLAMLELLSQYREGVLSELPAERQAQADDFIRRIFTSIVNSFNYRLLEGDFLVDLTTYSRQALLPGGVIYGSILGKYMRDGIVGIGQNEDSGHWFGEYLEYTYATFRNRTLNNIFTNFVRLHGIDRNTVTGFKTIIAPMLEQGHPALWPFSINSNVYSHHAGLYGVGDYSLKCLVSSHTPKEINELCCIHREVPTCDSCKFEQNRKVALRLERAKFWTDRSFIHNELPGAHEMLLAIGDYYDHRDDNDFAEYACRLEELENQYHFGVLPNVLAFDVYENPVADLDLGVYERDRPSRANERAIDILKRLIENTRPVSLEAPKTEYLELNQRLETIKPNINKRTGEVRVSMAEIAGAIKAVNELLKQLDNKQGVFPSTVAAIVFLDKMATYALRGLEQKESRELLSLE